MVYGPDSTYLDSGGLQNSIQRSTPTEQKTTPLSLTHGQGETISLDPVNSCFARQGCHLTCSQVSAQTRCILCQPVPSAQAEWDVPSHSQRLQTARVHSLSTFQNGDCAVRMSDCPSLRLDLFHRSDFACTDPASYKYLRLAVSPTEVFYFRALQFGLSTAPVVFTRIVESLVAQLRM